MDLIKEIHLDTGMESSHITSCMTSLHKVGLCGVGMWIGIILGTDGVSSHTYPQVSGSQRRKVLCSVRLTRKPRSFIYGRLLQLLECVPSCMFTSIKSYLRVRVGDKIPFPFPVFLPHLAGQHVVTLGGGRLRAQTLESACWDSHPSSATCAKFLNLLRFQHW